MRKSVIWVLFVFLAACAHKTENVQVVETVDSELEKVVNLAGNNLVQKPLINAASITVVHAGESYIGHYGELEKGKGNRPSNSTIYEIGSLGKVLTGTLMAKAVVAGKVGLEDELTQFLPKAYQELSFTDEPIRIKHLLAHTSGLPNVLPLNLIPLLTREFLSYDTPSRINTILSDYDKEKFLQDLSELQVESVPGSQYSYSSAGTELVALVLEEVYQRDFGLIISDFLASEIGMSSTKIKLAEEEKTRLAIGYHVDNPEATRPMQKLPWGAGGSMKTTPADMLKFIEYQLTNNTVVQESHKVLYERSPSNKVAYFWQINLTDETLGKFFVHHGGVPSAQSFVFILPEKNTGLFIITNQSGKDTAKKLAGAAEEIFNGLVRADTE